MTNEQESEEVRLFKETKIKAEQGDAEAGFRLSQMYERGEGVPPNYAEAVKWSQNSRKMAEQGDAETQFKMGVRYHKMKDYVEAARWYEMASEQGHAKAQDKLGCMYANGEGVSQDYDKAARWLWKAQHDKSPQVKKIMIALMYSAGGRVQRNEVEAYAWVLLSAEENAEDSSELSELISSFEKGLTAKQIKKGKERAAELHRLIKERKP